MKLPNGDRAELGDKLERYVLNPTHFKGQHKATLFRKHLGITLENKAILEEALLNAAKNGTAVVFNADKYGIQYDIEFQLRTASGQSWILSCWIITPNNENPRLTNAYPIRKPHHLENNDEN